MRILSLLVLLPAVLAAQTPASAAPCPSASPLLTSPPVKGVGVKTIAAACPAFVLGTQAWFVANGARVDTERWTSAQIMTALTTGVVPPAPAAVTAPPVVVPPQPSIPNPVLSTIALYDDDFSNYKNTADFVARFWVGPARSWAASPNNPAITYDTVEKALRYDWPARSPAPCTGLGAEITTALMPRLYPPPPNTKEIWVRFTTKESPNFEHGRTGCGGRSYKYFLIQLESGTTANPKYGSQGVSGRVGTYLGDESTTSMLPTNLWMDLNDNLGSPGVPPTPSAIGGAVSWGGQYHTWVLGLENIGTATATFSAYLDGQLVRSIGGSFLNGMTLGPGWAITFEMGANINNGPDHAQSRWWREFGVYTTKPSLAPLVIR